MAVRTILTFEEQAGNTLLEGGFITKDQLDDARAVGEAESTNLLDAMVSHGMVDQETLVTVINVQLGIPVVDLKSIDIDLEAVTLFPEKDARQHLVMPIGFDTDGSLRIVTLMPDDSKLSSKLSALTGFPTTLVLAIGGNLEDLIDRTYAADPVDAPSAAPAEDDDTGPKATSPLEDDAPEAISLPEDDAPEAASPPEDDAPEAISLPEDDAPEAASPPEDDAPKAVAPPKGGGEVIFQDRDLSKLPAMQAVETVTLQAVESGASDIHLVPSYDSAKVLFRMNGDLQQMVELPLTLHENMVSRIKAEAGMDTSEDQRPQDGGFSFNVDERRWNSGSHRWAPPGAK